jgi:hypothetical protein
MLHIQKVNAQSFWDPLCGDPRFAQIVASLAPRETPNVIH